MKKRAISLIAAAALAVGLGGAALAASSSLDNSLVSRDYLEGTFLQGLRQSVDQLVEELLDPTYQAAKNRLDSLGQQYAGTAIPDGWTGSSRFVAQRGGEGDSVTLSAGSGILWTSGNAVSDGVLVDVTLGSELASGAALQASHRYLAAEQTTVTVTSQSAAWAVEGVWTAGDGQSPFTDVDPEAYYYPAVLWAVENGITGGVSDTQFDPDGHCTRAQMVTFLWRAAGQPEPDSLSNPFADVSADAYYYRAVLWAAEQEVTDGVSDTQFDPDGQCSRGQMVTFLWRAAGQPQAGSGSNAFTDVDAGEYYYQPILWAYANDITDGTSDSTFSPAQICSRAQAVTFLHRAR